MAKGQSIPPFPADIDRSHFASWISGFSDGEACFLLKWREKGDSYVARYAIADFIIGLRADDRPILELIQSYWGVGHVRDRHRPGLRGNDKPQSEFWVSRTADLWNVLVPHYDRYPLLAKKRRDYAIWREGVEIMYRILRRRSGRSRSNPRWTESESDKLKSLADALKEVRQYDSAGVVHSPLPKREPPPQLLLFGS